MTIPFIFSSQEFRTLVSHKVFSLRDISSHTMKITTMKTQILIELVNLQVKLISPGRISTVASPSTSTLDISDLLTATISLEDSSPTRELKCAIVRNTQRTSSLTLEL